MKQIAFLIFGFAPLLSYTQEIMEDCPPVAKSGRVKIGLNFSPDFCSRTLTSADDSESSKAAIANYNGSQQPKFGFTTGLSLLCDISQRFTFETGLHYSNKGFGVKEFDLTYSNPGPDDPTSFRANYAFHYIEIPAKICININHNNTRYFFSAGLTTGFLATSTVTNIYSYADGSSDRSTQPTFGEFKHVNLAPTLGLGVDFFITTKMSLRIEPTFRYYATQIIKGVAINTALWNCGINFGYYISL